MSHGVFALSIEKACDIWYLFHACHCHLFLDKDPSQEALHFKSLYKDSGDVVTFCQHFQNEPLLFRLNYRSGSGIGNRVH